ncbi:MULTISPECIES: nucleoid occlusion protein [Caloramator]|uniref:Chromosome partitioning protein, ParB family n=1 Tax=Caloramator proteoclasticus DSM 10124 TaxID=1121262 RepID=A0A1M4ZUV3_9CLOT|nr:MULTISPECIES: nucleoid occlusion protein [Caloramator]SHF21597.1 chromosome partitioning protein, ParB family [Caloramator proteoclasticus DSM 10124]
MKAEREIINIPITKIRQNMYQPRKVFNQEALIELSESIREFGVLQPISVRRINDNLFELVAGERRLRASQLAGLTEIPAIIVDITDTESAVLALIENLQREDLNYLEEAEGYYNLIKEHGFTQEELAVRIGKKQSTIANKLRLLKLSDEVKERLISEGLTERHARALLKLEDEELQKKVINEVIKKGLTVKKTEELIEKILNEKQNSNKNNKNIKNKYKWNINTKIITNTIKQIMEKSGIEAEYKQKELDEYLEIVVRIPKK